MEAERSRRSIQPEYHGQRLCPFRRRGSEWQRAFLLRAPSDGDACGRARPHLQDLRETGTERAVEDALLGFGKGYSAEDKSVMLWHWGDNGDFKAFVMADPARKSGVVMFANGEDVLNVAKPIIDKQ